MKIWLKKVCPDKRLTIFTTFLFIFVSAFYLFYSLPYWKSSILWRDIEVSGIKLNDDGPEYRVSKGILFKDNEQREIKFELNPVKLLENDKVLRLAIFYQITKEDPIFMGPGLNIDRYNKSLENMERINSELKNDVGLKDDLLPISYLKETAEVLDKSNKFNNSVNFNYARDLLFSYKKTVKEYFNQSQGLGKVINESNVPVSIFNQAGGVTSKEIILSDIDKMSLNSKKLNKEIANRDRCLNISTFFCNRVIEEKFLGTSLKDNSDNNVDILAIEDISYPKDIGESIFSGPYKITSLCFKKENDIHDYEYLYVVENEGPNGKRNTPRIATNNYYVKVGPGDDILSRTYRDNGFDWRFESMVNSYHCNDTSYHTDLATINYFYKNYNNKNLFSDYNKIQNFSKFSEEMKNNIIRASNSEKKFFNSKYPSQSELDELSLSYQNLYNNIIIGENFEPNTELYRNIFSYKEEILNRYLIINSRFADFDSVLNYFYFSLEGYSELAKRDTIINRHIPYTYLMRNNYSIMFLNFSPSLWHLEDKLVYLDKDKTKIRSDVKDIDQMLSEYSKDYLDKINNFDREQVFIDIFGSPIK
jgi:hypothetical protein